MNMPFKSSLWSHIGGKIIGAVRKLYMLPLNYVILSKSFKQEIFKQEVSIPRESKKIAVDDLQIGFNSIILWFFENAWWQNGSKISFTKIIVAL